jgi:hypothetical protein
MLSNFFRIGVQPLWRLLANRLLGSAHADARLAGLFISQREPNEPVDDGLQLLRIQQKIDDERPWCEEWKPFAHGYDPEGAPRCHCAANLVRPHVTFAVLFKPTHYPLTRW